LNPKGKPIEKVIEMRDDIEQKITGAGSIEAS
jgi:hypothetical protein